MAVPQWAIAHAGSVSATAANAWVAAFNQNEWSWATARSNCCCAAALHETGKLTLPRRSVAARSCDLAGAGNNTTMTDSATMIERMTRLMDAASFQDRRAPRSPRLGTYADSRLRPRACQRRFRASFETALARESRYNPIFPESGTGYEGLMDLPRTASAVVIGGGVVGCSIAYHLARRGLADVVVVERETVGSGTTSKAAGGIRVQFPTETEIRFSLKAIRVFERFQDEFGVDPGYKKIGYLFLISDAKQLRGFEKRIALQRKLGADVRVITPDDARKLVPALRVDDLIAAVWGPGDGLAGPAEVTAGFARRARELGVKIVEGVRVASLERT